METWQYCAPCLMGVEGIVGDELKRMDAGEVRVENGRVLFSGGPELLARFQGEWVPLEDRYFQACRVRDCCQLVLSGQ